MIYYYNGDIPGIYEKAQRHVCFVYEIYTDITIKAAHASL